MKKQFSLFPWPPPLPVRRWPQPVDPEELARANAFIDELENDLRQHIIDAQPDLFPWPPPAPEPQWKTYSSIEELEALLDETVKELGRHSITELVRTARRNAITNRLRMRGPIIE